MPAVRSSRPELLPAVGLYVASRWGTYPRCVRCLGVRVGYVAARWVWSNAAAKSRVRGWKLCHAACLQAVSRASFASTAPTLAKMGQAGLGRLVGPSGGICGVVTHGGEHDVGESPFQAAQGFPFRLAGSAFAFVVDTVELQIPCAPNRQRVLTWADSMA
jgi:hypothetical protein